MPHAIIQDAIIFIFSVIGSFVTSVIEISLLLLSCYIMLSVAILPCAALLGLLFSLFSPDSTNIKEEEER
jgi:hypothetical protein